MEVVIGNRVTVAIIAICNLHYIHICNLHYKSVNFPSVGSSWSLVKRPGHGSG